jgi:drug/metabolite transporter (DMT)-like permease
VTIPEGPRAAAGPVGGMPWQVAPILALTLNAFTWGVSWWPFRQLQAAGLHPLWATSLIYLLAVVAITFWRPGVWSTLWRQRSLWLLVLASGTTNATFNWAVTIGDVVRVVLLFYLMPLWAVLLARWLLKEPLTGPALLRVLLALAGAAVVLWPAEAGPGLPLPRTLAEGLGVLGGFSFALNNVLLRREAHQPEAARALAMFAGGAVVSAAVALLLSDGGGVPWPATTGWGWVPGALAMGLAFLLSNLALQYGAARLPANVTAVVLVSEVLFAGGSAIWLGAGVLSLPLLLGGTLIVGATLLSAWR